jgi:hypothetical protein
MKTENLNDDEIVVKDNGNGKMFIWCVACHGVHIISTMDFGKSGNCRFNGDFYKPTFTPENGGLWLQKSDSTGVCAFTIRNGIISYLSHSTHIFAGFSVELRQRKDWGGITFKRNVITGKFDHEIKD